MAKATITYTTDLPEIEGRDPRRQPDIYLRKKSGTNEVEVVECRRPSGLLCVDSLREMVGTWRDSEYDGATATTKQLFHWWFEEAPGTRADGFGFYWGQREAIETIAYLVEVAVITDVTQLLDRYGRVNLEGQQSVEAAIKVETTMEGVRQARYATEAGEAVFDLPPADLARFAAKMGTGTGKTLLMAMVIVWSYFNATRETTSPLSTNFLVVAPNVIVYQRLEKDFSGLKLFRELPLVPPGWRLDLKTILRGEASEPRAAGNLVVQNIDQVRERSSDWTPANAIDALLGPKPSGDPSKARPLIDRLRSLDSLMVLNDEAHHVWDDELKWNQTLLDLHRRLPQGLDLWLDFSATPKDDKGRYFPWVICDYPLAQAVEDRIVKAPMSSTWSTSPILTR